MMTCLFMGFAGSAGAVTNNSAPLQLPDGWQQMTASQLAQYGIVPNIPAPDGSHVTVVSTSSMSGIATPNNYSGCSSGGQVCEWVDSSGGSGPDITYWATQTISAATCAYPIFGYIVGSQDDVWEIGTEYCFGPGDSPIEAASGLPHTFQVGTQLCAVWVGNPAIPGESCATVG